ncbi:MAG: sulfatase-like hydrolase/transferase, partial [Verrucomicrobiales bacterium]|nr:sulfatase-like hydrolase/transferase [Verrucomicrobiales bacterium]
MKKLFLFLALALVFGVPSLQAEAPRPNIILIFVDDLGYGDLGCYGNEKIKTPHLDQLSAEGQKWTSFYSSGSTCVPSRTGLMSGRHPGMLGKEKLRNDPTALMPAMLKRQ